MIQGTGKFSGLPTLLQHRSWIYFWRKKKTLSFVKRRYLSRQLQLDTSWRKHQRQPEFQERINFLEYKILRSPSLRLVYSVFLYCCQIIILSNKIYIFLNWFTYVGMFIKDWWSLNVRWIRFIMNILMDQLKDNLMIDLS